MNPTLTIGTGFSPKGYLEYGKKFLDSFDRFWLPDVQLQVYVEEETLVPRNGQRSLWSCPGIKEFIDKHSQIPKHCGREEFERWRPKDRGTPYAYRWDAVKFSRQCVIPLQASTELRDGDILAWFDGDVVTFKQVPPQFVENLLGDADLCYLGRMKFHTELGFWAVRLNPKTRAFLQTLANLYRDETIFDLWEWHSAFAFDHCLQLFRKKLNAKNLTPQGYGHVWFQAPMLGQYVDHLKGEHRKKVGRSTERIGR